MTAVSSLSPIQQLPASVINKIAAGEVIERPASLVKELMENSIDAGSNRIDVSVEKGGSELVRVTDTGRGIQADQMHLAIASHATSKLRQAEDLYSVSTLGFRGEALASIGEVSHLTLRSRTADADSGNQVEVIGGQMKDIVPCGCPPGTSIEVRNLFFNTPVRRKFMRTTQTEMSHCTEAFTRIALAYPHVHFTLTHNQRSVYDLAFTDDWRQRIARFFGDDLADALIRVERSDGDIHLAGYVANPSHSRANKRLQYLFLNGRTIRDRSLQHALSEAYRGLLLTGRYPICFLRVETPYGIVDVNVHPTKAEVRFQDSGRLYSHLLGTLRSKFLTTDLTARFEPDEQAPVPATDNLSARPHEATTIVPSRNEREGRTEKGFHPQSVLPPQTGTEAQRRLDDQPSFPELRAESRSPLSQPPTMQPVSSGPSDAGPLEATGGSPETFHPHSSPEATSRQPAIQIHNRYLIAESKEGVVVFDQHALHERILYEQLRETVLGGHVETQSLLVPEPVDLSAEEAAAVLDQRELLAQLGLEVKPFGGGTVLVCAYPAMLANMSPAEVLRDLIEHLLSGGKAPDSRDVLDELLQMISCKAAIKAGDRLSPDEITSLLQQHHLAQDSHHCPHGRPTALIFTREDLDRQFKRT